MLTRPCQAEPRCAVPLGRTVKECCPGMAVWRSPYDREVNPRLPPPEVTEQWYRDDQPALERPERGVDGLFEVKLASRRPVAAAARSVLLPVARRGASCRPPGGGVTG